MQTQNAAKDRLAFCLAGAILGDYTRSDFDFLPEAEHTRKDGTTSNTSLKFVNFSTGLVDIEGADDDEFGV